MHAEPASQFRGSSRFKILRQIGQGGAGSVYEAVDRESGSHVALKTLHAADPDALLHLKHEFRSIQDLSHPNLVTPQELFEASGSWFFSMEFVDGTDFLTYARSSDEPVTVEPTVTAYERSGEREAAVEDAAGGALDEWKLRAALRQLAVGVCALHADHKVHRDLKPSNVLVDAAGRVRILDFGIVWDLEGEKRSGEEGAVVGTITYMAPEQGGGEPVTPASDWYAVGVMVYQALTGRLPFIGTVTNILTRKVSEEPPAPALLDPTCPPDLSALCADLLRIDPTKRPEGHEVLRRLGITPSFAAAPATLVASFVGRRAELAALESAFEDASAGGRAVTLLVEGESGVGKSALVREFTGRVATAGAVVFRGRCYERESVPYKGVDAVVDDLSRYLASLRDEEAAALLPDDAPLLRTLFPVLDGVPAIRNARVTRSEVRNPQEARAQMFALLRAVLVNVALYRPLVVVIDDLQWADADSLALLSDVLRPPNAPPVLLLASIRSATHHAISRGGRASRRREEPVHDRLGAFPGDVRWIHLDPLPADAARDLVRNLLQRGADAGADAAPAEIDAICAEAKGHPLFIDELVRHRALHATAAPTRLDDALFERASHLPASARKLLDLVVVAGVPLPQQVAARATALDFSQLFDAVGALRAAHFVRTSGVYRHDTVEAYHDRVRHAVLAHVDERSRREWHGRLALALEQSGDIEPEKLVTHWLGAGETARAAGYAVRAAEDAAGALAFDHAASLYRLALELGVEGAAGTIARETETALRTKAAEALSNAGRGAEAAALYLEAAGDGTSAASLDLRRRAADELACTGHNAEGSEVIGSVLRTVGVYAPARPLAIILTLLFYSVVLALRGLGFTPRREDEIDPRALLRVDSLDTAGGSIGMSDHVRGKMYQVRTLVAALGLGEPHRIGRALAFYAAGHASTGPSAFDEAMKMQRIVRTMGEERNDPLLRGLASLVAGFAHFLSGRFVESRAPFEEAESIFRHDCVGVSYEVAALRSLLFSVLAHAGDLRELEARSDAALREAEQRGDLYSIMNLRGSTRTFLALAHDEAGKAEQELALAAKHLPPKAFLVQSIYCVQGRSQLALYRGEPAKARALLLERWPALERSLLLRVQRLRVLVNETRARIAVALLAAGSDMITRKTAEKEIHAVEREGLAVTDAYVHLLRAGLAGLDGARARALSELDAAATGFDGIGMPLVAAAARRQRGLVLGGEDGRALVAGSDAALTKRGVRNPARYAALLAPGLR